MDRKELLYLEAQLTDRERFCMFAYLLLKNSDPRASIKAYYYSRQTEPKANTKLLERKADEWIESDKCQAFIELYRQDAISELSRREKSITEEEKELSANEEMIRNHEIDIEMLIEKRASTKNSDDIIKYTTAISNIRKEISNIRHKNKSEFKDETKITKIYLPMRCNSNDCPLYAAEEARLKEKI